MSHPAAWVNLGALRLGEVNPRRNVGFTSIAHGNSKRKLEAYMSAYPGCGHGARRTTLQPWGLPVFQESQIEGGKRQDDADVHDEPFPESIPEEQHIDADDN